MIVSRETAAGWHSLVSRETVDRIRVFTALLQKWSRRINLLSTKDLNNLEVRHVADSLALLPLMPAAADRAVDLGSGAGFPGLLLAIASGTHFHLIESDHRKAAFLAEAARITEAPVTVVAGRIEHASCSPAMLVTSRALAPLDRLLALAEPFLTNDGVALFPKGRTVEAEIDDARKRWTLSIVQHRNTTSPDGVILQISQLARA